MSKWQKRAEFVLAQKATGTNSKRPDQFVSGIYPTHLDRCDGPYVWDVDNRRYIDFIGALGANILGYRHPKVEEAVIHQLKRGYISGSLPSPIEVEVAEKVCEMFHVERVRFLKTGNEATSAAVRIARAATGKSMVYNEGYHGHGDLWTYLTPPAAGVKDHFEITNEGLLTSGGPSDYACFISETVQLELNENIRVQRKEMAKKLQSSGIPWIHDEIITGGRVPKYSATGYFDIRPDLICLGKGLANGLPISIVAGRADLMDQPDYFISSTFSGEALSLAACQATLNELSRKNMEEYFYYANRFQTNLNAILGKLDLHIHGYGTRGMFPTTKNDQAALFLQECCKAGILFGKAYFYSMAHIDVEDQVIHICGEVVDKILRGDVKLEGTPPKEPYVRKS